MNDEELLDGMSAEELAELEERRAMLDESQMGTPADELTHAVDVGRFVDRKKAAMAAHGSQITDDSWFLTMPDEVFARAFGTEWFIHRGAERTGPPFATDLLAVLTPEERS